MRSITDIAALFDALPRPVSNRPRVTADHPADLEDKQTRAAYGTGKRRSTWGKGLRAAYYAELPPTPLGRVTLDQARLYLDAVIRVREMRCWSPKEQEKLRVIQRRWEKRARGEDRRFNALGGVFAGQKGKTPEDPWAELRKEIA